MTLFTILLLTVAGTIGSFFILFLLWILVEGFDAARQDHILPAGVMFIGYCIFGFGYLWDMWCNVLCNIVFLDRQREFTVSERLRRLVRTTGWRRDLAVWFAESLINPFSVGGPHIKIPTA